MSIHPMRGTDRGTASAAISAPLTLVDGPRRFSRRHFGNGKETNQENRNGNSLQKSEHRNPPQKTVPSFTYYSYARHALAAGSSKTWSRLLRDRPAALSRHIARSQNRQVSVKRDAAAPTRRAPKSGDIGYSSAA